MKPATTPINTVERDLPGVERDLPPFERDLPDGEDRLPVVEPVLQSIGGPHPPHKCRFPLGENRPSYVRNPQIQFETL